MRDERAQVHTLEAFTAVFIMLFTITLTLQTASIASTGDGGTLEEMRTETKAEDILVQSRDSGQLKQAILNWSGRFEGFNGSVRNGSYYSGYKSSVPGRFGESLSILREDGIAYNVYLVCDGNRHAFVKNSRGGGNPAAASVTVALSDEDRLRDGTKLEDSPTYPCEDRGENSRFYNSVEVRIIAWDV